MAGESRAPQSAEPRYGPLSADQIEAASDRAFYASRGFALFAMALVVSLLVWAIVIYAVPSSSDANDRTIIVQFVGVNATIELSEVLKRTGYETSARLIEDMQVASPEDRGFLYKAIAFGDANWFGLEMSKVSIAATKAAKAWAPRAPIAAPVRKQKPSLMQERVCSARPTGLFGMLAETFKRYVYSEHRREPIQLQSGMDPIAVGNSSVDDIKQWLVRFTHIDMCEFVNVSGSGYDGADRCFTIMGKNEQGMEQEEYMSFRIAAAIADYEANPQNWTNLKRADHLAKLTEATDIWDLFHDLGCRRDFHPTVADLCNYTTGETLTELATRVHHTEVIEPWTAEMEEWNANMTEAGTPWRRISGWCSIEQFCNQTDYTNRTFTTVLVNYLMPFGLESEIELNNGQTLYTKACDGPTNEGQQNETCVSSTNFTSGPSELAFSMHNNGGSWFRFIGDGFTLQASDSSFKIALALNLDGAIKAYNYSQSPMCDFTDPGRRCFQVPQLNLAPIVYPAVEKLYIELYLLHVPDPMQPYMLVIGIYFTDLNPDETKQSVMTLVYDRNSTREVSNPPHIYALEETEDGLGFLDWQGNAFVSHFTRLASIGDTSTCTGSTMNWMEPESIPDVPYGLIAIRSLE